MHHVFKIDSVKKKGWFFQCCDVIQVELRSQCPLGLKLNLLGYGEYPEGCCFGVRAVCDKLLECFVDLIFLEGLLFSNTFSSH